MALSHTGFIFIHETSRCINTRLLELSSPVSSITLIAKEFYLTHQIKICLDLFSNKSYTQFGN